MRCRTCNAELPPVADTCPMCGGVLARASTGPTQRLTPPQLPPPQDGSERQDAVALTRLGVTAYNVLNTAYYVLITLVLLFCIGGLLYQCAKAMEPISNSLPPSDVYTVTYRVRGMATGAELSYNLYRNGAVGDKPERVRGQRMPLPYEISFTGQRGQELYIAGEVGTRRWVTCEIVINGQVVRTETGYGDQRVFGRCVCSGRL